MAGVAAGAGGIGKAGGRHRVSRGKAEKCAACSLQCVLIEAKHSRPIEVKVGEWPGALPLVMHPRDVHEAMHVRWEWVVEGEVGGGAVCGACGLDADEEMDLGGKVLMGLHPLDIGLEAWAW